MKKCQTRKDIKSNNGITLIALVITIIVLLILAGVSISMITGDNSIMGKAKQAKEETEKAQEFEKVQMAVINTIAESSTGKVENGAAPNNFLEKNLTAMGITTGFGTSAGNSWKVQGASGQWYQIFENGQVTKQDNEPSSASVLLNNITLNPASATLTTGGTAQINVVFDPAETTDKTVTYTSNDTSVATVSATGLVTAVGAGSTTITVAGSNNKSATFTVTVANPVVTIADVTTIAQAKEQNAVAVESGITTLKDAGNHDIKIPAKFHIASESATDRADGIVIEDSSGNQFVWIPVDETTTYSYARTAFKGDNITSSYTESMPSDEQTSVDTNKGYYIGRFEAGDSVTGYTEDSTKNNLRTSSTGYSNAVSIKKGCAPYNWISKTDAITRAEAMAGSSEQNYGGTTKTKLCSSYAWDTAINFIQSKGGEFANYGSSSPQGNYKNTSFTYTNIAGAENQSKEAGENSANKVIVPTGQTTAVCNIYDMGGNVWEWTSEASSLTGYPCTRRGGGYDGSYGGGSAGGRNNDPDAASGISGFRVTLYL